MTTMPNFRTGIQKVEYLKIDIGAWVKQGLEIEECLKLIILLIKHQEPTPCT